ncbi:hypothetical protein GCT13_13145 [Paraburkholderia sp. CNPSo 3157]|uniref:Uncharacterized protein n=1 Tax=Paraburkholderia franconis TaxID=2654983 RepID=A0A7X1NAC5_9BURK|nr:hypothetical protein [Paraburkholderia franconis]MPW17858.1 hypothetical protein [Paraburkholderia franconis]
MCRPVEERVRCVLQKFVCELAGLVIVGNGRDISMNYPRLGDWQHRLGPMIWLTSTGFVIDTSKWPGGFNLGDHSIDLVASGSKSWRRHR